MKSIFLLTCVVLFFGISCGAPKKAEMIPTKAIDNSAAGETNLVRAIAGTYMLKTGTFKGLSMDSIIKDVTIKLCPNGKFLIRYASPAERGMADHNSRIRGADDQTETSLVRGTWHIEGTPKKGQLTMVFRNGKTDIYIYEVKNKGWLSFNQADYWRMGSAHCR